MKKNVFIVIINVVATLSLLAQPDGCIGYWPFNGNADDESSNNNNGIVYGAVPTTDRSGNVNSAFSFDGTDDYIDLGNSYGKPQQFTLAAWIRPNNHEDFALAISCNSSLDLSTAWGIYLRENGYAEVYISNGSTNQTAITSSGWNETNYPVGNWTFVTATVSGSQISYYVNGTLVDQIPQTLTQGGTGYGLSIGRVGEDSGLEAYGSIDDVYLFSRELEQAEIQALYTGVEIIPVTGVSLDQASVNLTVGESTTLIASVSPADATNTAISWSSDNPSIATVTNGVVNAISEGIANITTTTGDGGYTANCQVTVENEIVYLPPVANAGDNLSITLPYNESSAEITLDGSASYDPDGGSITHYEWMVNNVTICQGENPTCTYTFSTGTHVVSLIVSDDEGSTHSSTVTIEITQEGPPTTTLWKETQHVYLQGKNVGIGTTSPAAKLHLANTSHAALLLQNTTDAYDAYRARMGIYGSSYDVEGEINIETVGMLMQTTSNGGSSWTNSLFLAPDGRVGVKTVNPNAGAALTVNGAIHAKRLDILSDIVAEGSIQSGELDVNGAIKAGQLHLYTDVPTSDYVFESDYKLMKLSDLEQFVTENKHLPEVPSAKEFTESGYNVGEMDDLLLRKIEELTLYILELEKRLNNKLDK